MKNISWEFKFLGVVAVGLIAFLGFMFVSDAQASGGCPASPGDIEGKIRCGEMTCDLFRANASYVMGGSCSHKPQYYCCVNGGPFRMMESVQSEPLTIQFLERGNRHFDGLTNGVRVRMLVNGKQVDQGRFIDGYLMMGSGDRYLVLGGDLFLVR